LEICSKISFAKYEYFTVFVHIKSVGSFGDNREHIKIFLRDNWGFMWIQFSKMAATSHECSQVVPCLHNKCYLHIVEDAKSDIKTLTSKRLSTIVQRIDDWKGLYGKQRDIAVMLQSKAGLLDFVDKNSGLVRLEDVKQRYPDFGFHEECYQKFTNISILNKISILRFNTA
jgi:hypothetical protein